MAAVTHLVLPAAGFGTRMRAVDPDRPKELLPLGAGRVLDRAVMEAEAAGIREVVVVIRKGKEILRQHLEDMGAPCTFTFVYQAEQLGECDAIYRAREVVGDAPFAVLYPDNVAAGPPTSLRSVLDCLARAQADRETRDVQDMIALSAPRPEHCAGLGNAGRIDVENLHSGLVSITDFLPKGPGHFTPRFPGELRANGVYTSGPHFFAAVEQVRNHGYMGELTDGKVRRAILESGRRILGCPVGPVLDSGNPTGYAHLLEILG